MKLTILMPCLNEAETLETCIRKANQWINDNHVDAEVLIADNGSNDGSQAIALRLGARVVPVVPKGYGNALFYGCMAANGKYIIMGDSDDSYDFSRLSPFLDQLERGYDLVMGNRFKGGIAPGAMPWKNKYIGNPILSWIGKLLFKCPANDFHCGLRGFTKDAFLRMDLRTTGMEFASEMVIKANIFGMRIIEVPTTLAKDGRSRPPHLRPWRDGWRHLRFMLLFSPRWLFLWPGTFLLALSSIAYLGILSGPLKVGTITFDIHTLFFTQAGIILGLATIILGVLIKMIGMREGLLQDNELLIKLSQYPILEIGGVVGLFSILMGIYLALESFARWSDTGFGPLAYGVLLRLVSLSTSCIILGGLILIASLVMGFMALPTRSQRA